MGNFLLRTGSRALLWLRYRLRSAGLDEIAAKGTKSILFLPNHPALIDAWIAMVFLNRRFAPRAVADSDRLEFFALRWLYAHLGFLPIPSVAKHGIGAREKIEAVLEQAAEGLKSGENFLFYPAGHIYRGRYEDLRGNSGVETILKRAPETRIVLVRIRGLWGSRFSWAEGRPPSAARALKWGARCLLANGLFFSPRRGVTVEFHEPGDLPRVEDRQAFNGALEEYFNEDAPPNTYVPYTIWEGGKIRAVSEPVTPKMDGKVEEVPDSVRDIVHRQLHELTGRKVFHPDESLAHDLGLDSLARTELLVWVEGEFGFPQGDADALLTVGDLLLAAVGETCTSEFKPLKPVAGRWFEEDANRPPAAVPASKTVAGAFLEQARAHPDRAIIADQTRGVLTYRDIVLAVMVLSKEFRSLEGERIGIMLPACAAANVVYLAALFAGRIPVMVNWTTGPRNLLHSLDLAGVRRVLTAQALVSRLEAQGTDLSALKDRLVPLEGMGESISWVSKLVALVKSRLSWASLRRAVIPETAVILFTSGSESLPKAVPLTHENLLSNLKDVMEIATLRKEERLIGFLPPFHAFGLTTTMLLPLCVNLRTVYHTNPNEGAVLARLIEAYGVTVLVGTPTFLNGVLRSSHQGQLNTLRLAVTGAEKCPDHVFDMVEERCPGAKVLEGYGVTECSPVVSVTPQEAPRRGTVGRIVPSLEFALLDVQTGARVSPPGTGVLHLRGPSVFEGYLNHDGASPFAQLDGREWYRTGDIVTVDEDGILTFRGRLKRFIKLGGEMISLPAIEEVLLEHNPPGDEEGPQLAVEAAPGEERAEIVLFTTSEMDRVAANERIREAGLSALHNIRRTVKVDEIPILGTGKTDYRALKAML
ncbi:MAG: AMP-binding protein [Planctomycetota bacterium]|jgi:long-chain-fatty-acid--[acyl-carrier-protein] ligase